MYMYSLIKEAAPPFAVSREPRESKEGKEGHLDNVQRWWERGVGRGGNVSLVPFYTTRPFRKSEQGGDLSAPAPQRPNCPLSPCPGPSCRLLGLDPVSTPGHISYDMNREYLLRRNSGWITVFGLSWGQSLTPSEERDKLECGICKAS